MVEVEEFINNRWQPLSSILPFRKPPEEHLMMSALRGRYTLMLVPRKKSSMYTFINNTGDPLFKDEKSGKFVNLSHLISNEKLTDYQYFNLPTYEIKEYPCVIFVNKSTNEIKRYNYMDYKLALHEYNALKNKYNLIEIQGLKEDNILNATPIRWYIILWKWLKGLFKIRKNNLNKI